MHTLQRHSQVMLLRPKVSCRQPQSGPTFSSCHFFSPRPVYLLSRTYATPRPYESKPRVLLQPSQPASVALNPPITTHPPPLSLPEKLPDLPKYKYYFRIGKAYGVFYKNGLQAIWTNYKLARALPHHVFSGGQAKVHQAVRDGILSRADFQLICRTRHDINKVPLFALIWLICGEFTPLVVIFFTGAVPRTIWIPKQVQKAREEAEKRRSKSKKESVVLFAGPPRRSDIESIPLETQRIVLKSYAQSLGLYPAWWDRWFPTLIPTSLVRRRVYGRLEELEVDDFAIGRDGGAGKMAGREIWTACEERGIDTMGKEESHLRRNLQQWMDQRRTLVDERDGNVDGKIGHTVGAGK
ncbi:MAG: hypothetical protein Q9161_001107 [Pseudevernia consocians]